VAPEFQVPVDCDDNNYVRPTENIIAAALGSPSPAVAVSVTTGPQPVFAKPTDKPSSAPAGKMTSEQPVVCTGDLCETVAHHQQQQQQQQLQSGCHYVPTGHGEITHNASFMGVGRAIEDDYEPKQESKCSERPIQPLDGLQMAVFPKFQGRFSDGSGEINKLSDGNCLVKKDQAGPAEESNLRVNVVDNSIPGVQSNEPPHLRLAGNYEHVNHSKEEPANFEPIHYYKDTRPGAIIYSKPDLVSSTLSF